MYLLVVNSNGLVHVAPATYRTPGEARAEAHALGLVEPALRRVFVLHADEVVDEGAPTASSGPNSEGPEHSGRKDVVDRSLSAVEQVQSTPTTRSRNERAASASATSCVAITKSASMVSRHKSAVAR
jgi:hypothetical protein